MSISGYWTSDGYVLSQEDIPAPRQGAGWIFATESGHILLVKCAHSGKWGFCKGHKEPSDSSLLDTAKREAKEELGLSARKEDYVISSEPFMMRAWSYHVEFRYAVLKKPLEELVLQPEEIAEVRLVTLQEMRAAAPDSLNRFARKWLTLVKDM
jgi:8-oxo-dGTP pyrophosphatase MutT (NUDIX family)